MTSFILYVIGFFVLLTGMGYGAFLLHVPQTWIIVGVLVITGAGIMSSGSHIKRHFYPGDTPEAEAIGPLVIDKCLCRELSRATQ